MRVLVTGGAGFIGSHLVDMLMANGHEIAVLDNLSTGQNLRSDCRFVKADVCSPLGVLSGQHFDAVVHLAAQISVDESVKDPGHDLSVNVGGVINVFKAAAACGVKKVIFLSSAAVYGIPEQLPITETHPTAPISPYGLSKLTGEHYVRLLGESLGVAYTIIRPANVFGPRQLTKGEGAVIPAFLSRFLAGIDPVIHGTGSQTRDFLFVTDMARAIMAALTQADGMTLNVGGGVATTIMQLWSTMARLADWRRSPVYGAPRPQDITHSVLQSSRAQDALNWQPMVSLEAGLVETLASYAVQQVSAASSVRR